VFDLNEVRQGFTDLTNITFLNRQTGQRIVFSAELNSVRVALKIFNQIADAEQRLEREIKAVGRLQQLRVPRPIRHGKVALSGEDRLYIIEQWIEGHNYDQVLLVKKIQPLKRVYELVDALLDSCEEFESVGLIHRDLKPANLKIDADGKLWVLDVIQRMDCMDLPQFTIADEPDGKFAEFIAALSARFPSRRPQSACEAIEWFDPIYTAFKQRIEQGQAT